MEVGDGLSTRILGMMPLAQYIAEQLNSFLVTLNGYRWE